MFNRILCPTDLSQASELSLGKGAELARLCRAELILLNVRPEFMSKEEMIMLRTSVQKFQEEGKEMALAAKDLMLKALRKSGDISDLNYQMILREGEPDQEIIEVAESMKCDLIVVTTTGRNHLIEHIKGSDTEQMLSVSHVPMLIFPVLE